MTRHYATILKIVHSLHVNTATMIEESFVVTQTYLELYFRVFFSPFWPDELRVVRMHT